MKKSELRQMIIEELSHSDQALLNEAYDNWFDNTRNLMKQLRKAKSKKTLKTVMVSFQDIENNFIKEFPGQQEVD